MSNTESIKYMKVRVLAAKKPFEVMKPCRMRNVGIQALHNWDDAVKVLEGVEDIVGQPGAPCPVQSQSAISALRRIFGITVKRQAKAKHAHVQPKTQPQPDSPASCGPGPYCVKIVRAGNLYDAVWTGSRVYKTEGDAVRAVIRKAVRAAELTHGWTVDKDCVRHWISDRKEHIVDFGSHSYYGVVTGKETI